MRRWLKPVRTWPLGAWCKSRLRPTWRASVHCKKPVNPQNVQPYALLFTDQYNRRAAKFLKQHPALRSTYLKTLQLLQANPAHPSLRLHALRGKLEGTQVSIRTVRGVGYRIEE